MEDVQKIELVSEHLEVSKDISSGKTAKLPVHVSTQAPALAFTLATETISIETGDIGHEVAEAPSFVRQVTSPLSQSWKR